MYRSYCIERGHEIKLGDKLRGNPQRHYVHQTHQEFEAKGIFNS